MAWNKLQLQLNLHYLVWQSLVTYVVIEVLMKIKFKTQFFSPTSYISRAQQPLVAENAWAQGRSVVV